MGTLGGHNPAHSRDKQFKKEHCLKRYIKREEIEKDTQTHRKKPRQKWVRIMLPQIKEYWKLLEAGRDEKEFSPRVFRGTMSLLTL